MTEHLRLRPVVEEDLPVFFSFQLDPEANYMAAFTAKDPTDQRAFAAHWSRIGEDPTCVNRTIVCGEVVVGNVSSYEEDGRPEVTYWIGRSYWGRGIATLALRTFLREVQITRPIYARVARDNPGSLRVLEKCGFEIVGEARGFANARGQEIDELILELKTLPDRPQEHVLAHSCSSVAGAEVATITASSPDERSALLVVDAQVGVISSLWDSERIIENLGQLVRNARDAGTPVIWVQHSGDGFDYGSDSWQIVPSLAPATSEVVIHKKFNSSFAETDLDERLRALGVSRLILAGAATNWCIRSTAYAAVERGYHLTLVADAHTTESLELPDGKAIPAEMIVDELNTVFQWISVPQTRTEVRDASAVTF